MQALVPYQKEASHENEGMSIKEKIGYGIIAGLSLSAIVYFGGKMIKKNRANNSDALSFQDGSSQTLAKQIKMAFENDGDPGTDVKKLRYILTHIKSKDEMENVRKEFTKQYSTPLYKNMQDELQSSEYDEMLQIIEGKPQKTGQNVLGTVLYLTWAKRLKAAFSKMYGFIPGTDEEAIKTVFQEIPTQRAFINVGVAYYKQYKTNLLPDLKSELQSWEYPEYMMMITNKPKA